MFPARAGVILDLGSAASQMINVPRASGGDPLPIMKKAMILVCSPRERG